MSLTLHFHPLSSFCQKVLVALYEKDVAFTPHIVHLGEDASRAAFLGLWPIGRFPVLRDDAKGRTVPETSIIIEYLEQNYLTGTRLIPAEPERALDVRLADRFYDLYVNVPMQKIVGDRLAPDDRRDPLGVERARGLLRTALDLVERDMAQRTWAAGEAFSMADCAAAPALFYADQVMPFGETHKHVARYFSRLKDRPSYKRVAAEAEPYLKNFPRA